MSGDGSGRSLPAVPLEPLLDQDPRELGPFRILGRLGAGGMGVAYLADGLGEWAVVKRIRSELAEAPSFRARLRRELDAIERLNGESARLLQASLEGPDPWFAMEFINGTTLDHRVRDRGPLSGSDVRAFAQEFADVLAGVHEAGIVHRDIKPGNVMLSPDGPRLIDFGIAEVDDGTHITRTGSVMGSFGWLAPEQVRGDATSTATDVHAWALCVLFAATGSAPFGSDTGASALYRVLESAPDVPVSVPDPLRTLVTAALAKEPAQRPSLDDIRSTFTQSVASGVAPEVPEVRAGGEGPPVREAGNAGPAEASGPPIQPSATILAGPTWGRERGRGPWLWVMAGAGVLVLVAAILVGVTRGGESNTTASSSTAEVDVAGSSGESVDSDGGDASGSVDTGAVVSECTNDSLKIGTLLPATGVLAYLGPPQFAAVDMAVEDIDEAGGVLGRPVVNEFGDSGDITNDLASRTVEAHVANGVQAIVGASSSGVTLTVLPEVVRNGIAMISATNTSPSLSEFPDDGLYFRTSASDVLQGMIQARAARERGFTRGASIVRDDPYGLGLQRAFGAEFVDSGGSVRVEVDYAPESSSFEDVVAEVAAVDPDVVQVVGFDEVEDIIQEMIKQGIGPQDVQVVMADGSLSTSAYSGLPRGTMDGVLATAPRTNPAVDLDAFGSRLLEFEPGLESLDYGAESYDSTILLAVAAEYAGCADGRAIAAALPLVANADAGGEPCTSFAECRAVIAQGGQPLYVGVSGPLDFNEYGDPREGSINVVEYVSNTRYEVVDEVTAVVPLV